VADSYDYAYEDHLAGWHERLDWLLASVSEIFIAYGELERARNALLDSVVGVEMAKDLRSVRKQRNILAHELTGMVENTDEDPALMRDGGDMITPEELADYVEKCRRLTERLTAMKHTTGPEVGPKHQS